MGVIDQDGDPEGIFHRLEPSGDRYVFKAFGTGLRRNVQGQGGGNGCEEIHRVVVADEGGFDGYFPPRRLNPHGDSIRTQPYLVGMDVCFPSGAVGRAGKVRNGFEEAFAVRVVQIDDGALVPFFAEGEVAGKEGLFGLEVILHAGVEVEMITGKVRPDGQVEVTTVNPVEGEGVRRDLHDHGLDLFGNHFTQGPLENQGVGGGRLGLDGFSFIAVVDGSDDAGGNPRL